MLVQEKQKGITEDMAISNNIPKLLEIRGENISEFARRMGIAYTTAFGLYHNTTKNISFELINKLCNHFGVGPGELFPYLPDKPGESEK